MLLGYNTNGFAHHDPFDAVGLLAEIGYRSVAITLDHGPLNPFASDFASNLERLRRQLDKHEMRSVIETGARFLLDPRQKHEPTLVSSDPASRARRLYFLCHAVDAARMLGSDCVSLWAGVVQDGLDREEAFTWLRDGLDQLLDYAQARSAAQQDVPIGFEPEPGMLIDTMDTYAALSERIDAPHFRLTLDVGHLHCQGELPISEHIQRWRRQMVNVHIEDMRSRRHEHLMFGEGEMDFGPIIESLASVKYPGGVHVELSRHSHEAPQAARKAFDFLSPLMAKYERGA